MIFVFFNVIGMPMPGAGAPYGQPGAPYGQPGPPSMQVSVLQYV